MTAFLLGVIVGWGVVRAAWWTSDRESFNRWYHKDREVGK